MTIYEAFGFGYIVTATAFVTICLLFLCGFAVMIGIETGYRWLRRGQIEEQNDIRKAIEVRRLEEIAERQ